MTALEAETLFKILSVLEDIHIELKSINKRLNCLEGEE